MTSQDERDFWAQVRGTAPSSRAAGASDAAELVLLGRLSLIKSLGLERSLADALQIDEGEFFARDPGGKLYRYAAGAYRAGAEQFVAGAAKRLLKTWQVSQRWRSNLADAVC